MLEFDTGRKKLSRVKSSTLQASKLMERTDLQAAFVASWEAFRAELGFEELHFIGQEIKPHKSCDDRIDILALDTDGRPIIMELKRGRDKLQLLQAITYAAMVSTWDADRLRNEARTMGTLIGDLADFLDGEGFELGEPRLVLIAEAFDPEVIIAAEWLASYGLDVTAFAISLLQHQGALFMSIDQRYPLPGLDDVYESRVRRRVERTKTQTSWDAVLPKLRFDFAGEAIERFLNEKPGDPARKRFTSMYPSSFAGAMLINLRRDYLKIYNYDQSEEAGQRIRRALGPEVAVDTWGSEQTRRSGYVWAIETQEQFDSFMRAVGAA